MKLYLSIFYIFIWYTIRPILAIPLHRNVSDHLEVQNYNLQYMFNFQDSSFICIEEIKLLVKEGTIKNELILDKEGLNVESVSLKDPTSSVVTPISFNNVNDFNITLTLPRALQTRLIYTIAIQFSGKLTSSTTGINIYEKNKKQYISTNFFPFYARKAFVCVNDVSMKSTFILTITLVPGKDKLIALSNMPYEYTNPEGTYFQFKETPKMPLHNLFFTVGHYEVGKMGKNIYLPRNNDITLNQELYNVLKDTEYNRFLNTTKLENVKIVCVPGMYPSTYTGYGIVAIREDNMYLDLKKITCEQRKQSLLNIFGALYKLFYGNILIPETWSDYWLSESVSTYLKYNAFSEIGDWDNPKEYISYDLQQKVLKENAYSDSPPIVDNSLKTEEDLLVFLNGPSFRKGAAVLIMLENALTKEVMSDVLSDYLLKNPTGATVTTKQFVKFICEHKEVINKIHRILDFSAIINPWLLNSGFPYIQTARAGSGVVIKEKTFIGGPGVQDDAVWNLPIQYATGKTNINDNNFFWLQIKNNQSVALNFTVQQNEWFVLNANGSGPFRVNYEKKDWFNIGISHLLDFNKFAPSTRAQLISDSFAFIYTGQANITTIFQFLSYLENEDAQTPWLTALDEFTYLRSLLYDTDIIEDLNNYMTDILSLMYVKLGIDKPNENNAQGLLRQKVVKAMCDHGNEGCVQDTTNDYNKMKTQSSLYTPNNDVRPIIICNGIRSQNDAKAWMEEFNDIFNNVLPLGKDVRRVYYEALACPEVVGEESNAGIEKFLESIFLNEKLIALEDIPMAFKAIYSNPVHVTHALSYFVYNEYIFREDITENKKIQLIREIAPYLTKNNQRDKLTEFVNKTKPSQNIVSAVKQTLDRLTKTQTFIEKNKEELKRAFHTKVIPPTPPPTVSPTGTTNSTSSSTTTKSTTHSTGSTSPSQSTTEKPKPSSASLLNAFNLFTLAIFYLTLHLIT